METRRVSDSSFLYVDACNELVSADIRVTNKQQIFSNKKNSSLKTRDSANHLRFEGLISSRTMPPPSLPSGSAHKLSQNSYYLRDARRSVEKPLDVFENNGKSITSPSVAKIKDSSDTITIESSTCTPGRGYKWKRESPPYLVNPIYKI